jgi:hypothetical protein
MESLAVRGELVANNPEDECASVLLVDTRNCELIGL